MVSRRDTMNCCLFDVKKHMEHRAFLEKVKLKVKPQGQGGAERLE